MKTHDPAPPSSEPLAQPSNVLELSDDELEAVSGGTETKKKGTASEEKYLEIKFSDLLISS